MTYDVIIVGAGIGGLAAALNLANNNKKVLILEKNSLPGGLVSTFKRGRFEFDTSIETLFGYGNEDHIGTLQKLLKGLEIDISSTNIPFNTRIKALDENLDYEIKENVEDWFLTLERLFPGSVDDLKNYLPVTKEIHEALEYIKNDKTLNAESFPHFYKYLNANVIEGLTDLNFSKEIIHNIGYVWTHLGSPLHKLSFIDFSDFMYKLFIKKESILQEKNLNFILKLVKKFESLGGAIYYRSEVTKIENEADKKVVYLKNGESYKAKDIICNISNRYVFKNLVSDNYPNINQIENARTIGPSSFVVFLGLNKSYEDLNLKNYKYFQFQSINSEKNIKGMRKFFHKTIEGYVPNVVNEDASPKNTTILILKTNYFSDVFSTIGNNYNQLKSELAKGLIEEFENAFKVDIQEYIEEIEIATPLTFLKYTNNPNGSIYGYMRLGYDNSIHRLLSYDDEKVPGISIVGGSSIFGSGIENAFYSGYYVSNKLLKEENTNE